MGIVSRIRNLLLTGSFNQPVAISFGKSRVATIITNKDLDNEYGDIASAQQEIYDYFFICPKCKCNELRNKLLKEDSYCGNCGVKLLWELEVNEYGWLL